MPLFVRIPGGGPGLMDDRTRFSSVVLHDLVEALFAGELGSHAELPAWLSSRAVR